jgi:hypothetical protein
VVTSPPPESKQLTAEARRGSNLGRSKSVKINRVKFDEDQGKGENYSGRVISSTYLGRQKFKPKFGQNLMEIQTCPKLRMIM